MEYSAEILTMMGKISEALDNFQKLLDRLPDQRDLKDVTKEVESIKLEIEKVVQSVATQITVSKGNKGQCVDTQQKILDAIESINKFSGTIKKLAENYKIKFGDIESEDIRDLLAYAKRKQQQYNYWSGWKIKVLLVAGTIGAITIFVSKFIELGKSIIKLLGG